MLVTCKGQQMPLAYLNAATMMVIKPVMKAYQNLLAHFMDI